jgi:3-oxoadipate enol-lactonase
VNQQVTLNGLPTRWREWGTGRPILCLHPLGQNADFFDGLAEALGDGWRVVSFDQRGHGDAANRAPLNFEQMVSDAAAALDRLGGQANLAGFSMGGAIAAELGARRAPDINTLSLIATPLLGLPVFAERACALRKGSIDAIVEDTVLRWFGRMSGEQAIDKAKASLEMMTPKGFDAAWTAFATFRGYGEIAGHLPPTLCLSFDEDLSTPQAVLDDIAKAIQAAGGKVKRADVSGAGHMGLLQKPREVAAELSRFITDQERRVMS